MYRNQVIVADERIHLAEGHLRLGAVPVRERVRHDEQVIVVFIQLRAQTGLHTVFNRQRMECEALLEQAQIGFGQPLQVDPEHLARGGRRDSAGAFRYGPLMVVKSQDPEPARSFAAMVWKFASRFATECS